MTSRGKSKSVKSSEAQPLRVQVPKHKASTKTITTVFDIETLHTLLGTSVAQWQWQEAESHLHLKEPEGPGFKSVVPEACLMNPVWDYNVSFLFRLIYGFYPVSQARLRRPD